MISWHAAKAEGSILWHSAHDSANSAPPRFAQTKTLLRLLGRLLFPSLPDRTQLLGLFGHFLGEIWVRHWQALAGTGRHWQALAGTGRHWQALAGTGRRSVAKLLTRGNEIRGNQVALTGLNLKGEALAMKPPIIGTEVDWLV
jgi:hypothetical protein